MHNVVLRLTFRIELDLRKVSYWGERKTGVLEKNTVGLWCRFQDWNSGHTYGRRVPSPLSTAQLLLPKDLHHDSLVHPVSKEKLAGVTFKCNAYLITFCGAAQSSSFPRPKRPKKKQKGKFTPASTPPLSAGLFAQWAEDDWERRCIIPSIVYGGKQDWVKINLDQMVSLYLANQGSSEHISYKAKSLYSLPYSPQPQE